MFHHSRPARRQDRENHDISEIYLSPYASGTALLEPAAAITVSLETSRGVFEMDMILILAAIAAGASFLILMVMEDWA
jgi:hypothetical protein